MSVAGGLRLLVGRALKPLQRQFLRILAGLAFVLAMCLHTAGQIHLPFIDQLENSLYDSRLNLTLKGAADESVVILDIDEKSLALPELGRWPWGQDKMATIVDTLFERYQRHRGRDQ